MFKGFWKEVVELSRGNSLRERLYKRYSLDELQRVVTAEAYSAVRPIFPVFDAIPQMESGILNNRTYSARTNEYECKREIYSSLRYLADSGAFYLHSGPQDLLKKKAGIDETIRRLELSWSHYSPRVSRALEKFKSATVTLEVGCVRKSGRTPERPPSYWYGKQGPLTDSPFSQPNPVLCEYPPDFEEIKAAAHEWWRPGHGTPTEVNRQWKAVWDGIHHLHEAVPVLEEYWRSLKIRGPSLAHEIYEQLERSDVRN